MNQLSNKKFKRGLRREMKILESCSLLNINIKDIEEMLQKNIKVATDAEGE